ncbi:unnamed protein product, partial [Meganyctiphanes norvegica]
RDVTLLHIPVFCGYCDAHCGLKTGQGENMNNVNCGICDAIVEEDSEGLYCDVCNCWYHNACGENPLIEDIYCLLNDAPINVKWFCDKCIWETEKWITSLNAGKSNDIIDDEESHFDNSQTSSEFGEQEVENSIESQTNISVQENKNIKKRGRPKKIKLNENVNKTDILDDECNYDIIKEPEVKIEVQNEDIDFDDSSYSYSDSWSSDDNHEAKENNKKKRRHGFKKKSIKRSYCNLCSKGFLKPEDFVAHNLWHDGDKKPY